MSDDSNVKNRIKKLLDGKGSNAIVEILRIEEEAHGKEKKMARTTVLNLLEMEHDFENLRDYIREWKMEDSFGKELIKRMKERIKQEAQNGDEDVLAALDRLNDAYWRKCSPKKSFPKYRIPCQIKVPSNIFTHHTTNSQNHHLPQQRFSGFSFGVKHQNSNNLAKEMSSQNTLRIKFHQDKNKNEKNEQHSKSVQENVSKGSSQSSKSGLASILKSKSSFLTIDKKQEQPIPPLHEAKHEESKPISHQEANSTPEKKFGPSVSLKIDYGDGEVSRIKEVDEEGSFIYSPVIHRQPYSESKNMRPNSYLCEKRGSYHKPGANGKKQEREGGGEGGKGGEGEGEGEGDRSYLNYTENSFCNSDFKKDRDNNEGKYAERGLASSAFANPIQKPLFTSQELSLISADQPSPFHMVKILKAEGYGACDMLRRELQKMKRIK